MNWYVVTEGFGSTIVSYPSRLEWKICDLAWAKMGIRVGALLPSGRRVTKSWLRTLTSIRKA